MIRISVLAIVLLSLGVVFGTQPYSQGNEQNLSERFEESDTPNPRNLKLGRFVEIEDEFEEGLDLPGEFEDIEEYDEQQIQLMAWVGVETESLEPQVRAHVPVEEDQGLMVYEVVDGSPAAKAGLKEFDILLSVNGEVLKDFDQFMQHVEKAKENALKVEVLRKGTKMEVNLKPGKRPWNFNVFMPGSITVPDDVKVTITKKGGQPVTISVQQNETTWTAKSEEEFGNLPEKVISWLFATVEEIVPFDEEEEFDEVKWFDQEEDFE